MRRLVQYAGFDPCEEDFDGVEPAPLHAEDLVPLTRQRRTRINLERAWSLKRLGRSWDEVGRLLALEQGRKVVYQGKSVRMAALFATQIVGDVPHRWNAAARKQH